MISIGHLVSPCRVTPSSDLYNAQPITLETMRRAKEAVSGIVKVELLRTSFKDEDISVPGFHEASPLMRDVSMLHDFKIYRKLPIFRDVLDRLYHESAAEYLIYTNIDIAVHPDFYLAVSRLIGRGHDAFVINRRTIPAHYSTVAELPRMYAEQGKPHRGYDCFVFRRDLYPSFVIGDVFLGSGHMDLPLICSMITYARNFIEIRDEHLTFHIGDSRSWWSWKNRQYIRACDCAAASGLAELALRQGWTKELRPHVRMMLRSAFLKNRIIVDEWMRLKRVGRPSNILIGQ